MAFSILNREDHQVFIGSGQVFGVQSVSTSYTVPEQPMEVVGSNRIIPIPTSSQVGEVSLSAMSVDKDPFIQCISDQSFNGYFLKDQNDFGKHYYAFNSGYLLSYSNSCSVGQVPTMEANFRVVGDMGRIPTGEMATDAQGEVEYIKNTTKTDPVFKFPTASTIEITLDDFKTNLVQNYQISINIPRKDYYKLGGRKPHTVKVDYPIVAQVNFTIEINDYSGNLISSYPCKQKLKNFEINLKNHKTRDLITQFAFSGATLVSENYSADTDQNARITATYKTYISNLNTLNDNLIGPELITQTY